MMMISMGMNLQVTDFRTIFTKPRPIIIGSVGQLLLLPLLAFGIIAFWPGEISIPIKIGLIILAACPGGIGSNVVAYLSKGDPALSVTLTLISSFSAVLTVPFLVNLALTRFAASNTYIPLPLLSTSLKIAVITIAPIMIGMFSKHKFPKFTQMASSKIQKVSIFLLILVVIGVLYKEQRILIELTKQAGAIGMSFCFLSLGMGYLLAKLLKLNDKQGRTIAIELGLQNIFLAVIICLNFLEKPTYVVVPAVYSPITMMASVLLVVFYSSIRRRKS
jgi:BASS family bile acid:Na+ symporter